MFETKYPSAESEDLHPIPSTNVDLDIRFGKHGNGVNAKRSISQEQHMNFYEMKKILNLHLP